MLASAPSRRVAGARSCTRAAPRAAAPKTTSHLQVAAAAELGAEETPPQDPDEWAKERRLAPLVMPEMPFPTLDNVLDHLDHIVSLVGADHAGIGHDFSIVYPGPDGLRDVSQYGNLTRRLLERGYTEPDVKKILGENLLRVWKRVTGTDSSPRGN